MDHIQPIIIPTLSKSKISGNLSYPVGAETISAALEATPQLAALKLHFYWGFQSGLKRGIYEFLRVEYLRDAHPAWHVLSLYKRPAQYPWEIIVQPVPRICRSRIKRYILETALPQISLWLKHRADLARRGNEILAFFYDETADEFTPKELSSLEPLQG